MRSVLAFAVAIGATGVSAADLVGKVVNVHDGDTLTILVETKQVRVRLVDIDAPELAQPFGRRSRQSLADMCAGKTASVAEEGKDRYGRTLGRVTCSLASANSEQVRRGMAWVFVKYAPKDSPLHGLEAAAKAGRLGLWYDSRPIAPWDWRRLSASKGRRL